MHPTQIKRMEEYYIFMFKEFKEKNGDWPRAHEIPTIARSIQRNLGGVPAFRKKHNLGYENYTKGDYRINVDRAATLKATVDEKELHEFLVSKYGEVNVHENPRIYSNTRNAGDFCIYQSGKKFLMVDVFYPKNLHSLKGCLNAKMKKYKDFEMCPVIFVQLNPNIKDEDTQEILRNKKSHLSQNIKVMAVEDFKEMINKQSVV